MKSDKVRASAGSIIDQQPAQHEPAANDLETMLSSLAQSSCAVSLSYLFWIPVVSTISNLGTGRLDGCSNFLFGLSH